MFRRLNPQWKSYHSVILKGLVIVNQGSMEEEILQEYVKAIDNLTVNIENYEALVAFSRRLMELELSLSSNRCHNGITAT